MFFFVRSGDNTRRKKAKKNVFWSLSGAPPKPQIANFFWYILPLIFLDALSVLW